MTIRITQNTLYSRALFDMQRGLFRYSQLQTEVATGRRVNLPSDDPQAALRILPLRGQLRDLQQMNSNGSLARETLDTSAASLEDASGVMQRARELATQAANSTLSNSDRQSLGAEIDQLLGQMLSIANSRYGDRYLFGGTESATAPFSLETIDGRTRAVYAGNRDTLEVDVAPDVATALNLPGDGIFMSRDRTATTFSPADGSLETGIASYGAGDTGVGFAQLDITFERLINLPDGEWMSPGQGETTALGHLAYQFEPIGANGPGNPARPRMRISGGPWQNLSAEPRETTFETADGRSVSLLVSDPGTGVASGTFTSVAGMSLDGGETVELVDIFGNGPRAVRNSVDGSVIYLDPSNVSRTGEVDVKFGGTFDVFTTLADLRDALVNADGLSDEAVRARAGDLLGDIDTAHDAVLDGLRELGFRSASIDVLQNRVEGLQLSRTESLSRIEDTDMAQAILELQRQDLSYQTALQVSARVLQTTLQGFLR